MAGGARGWYDNARRATVRDAGVTLTLTLTLALTATLSLTLTMVLLLALPPRCPYHVPYPEDTVP